MVLYEKIRRSEILEEYKVISSHLKYTGKAGDFYCDFKYLNEAVIKQLKQNGYTVEEKPEILSGPFAIPVTSFYRVSFSWEGAWRNLRQGRRNGRTGRWLFVSSAFALSYASFLLNTYRCSIGSAVILLGENIYS